jgi:hypothetical protein
MEWLEPWFPLAARPDMAAGKVREVQAELRRGHPLFGLPLAAAGANGSDDVLYSGARRVRAGGRSPPDLGRVPRDPAVARV